MKVVETTTTTITVEWSVNEEPHGSIQNSQFEISYKNTEYTDCFNISDTILNDADSAEGTSSIKDLQEGTNYAITVSLLRDNVVTDINTIPSATAETGI